MNVINSGDNIHIWHKNLPGMLELFNTRSNKINQIDYYSFWIEEHCSLIVCYHEFRTTKHNYRRKKSGTSIPRNGITVFVFCPIEFNCMPILFGGQLPISSLLHPQEIYLIIEIEGNCTQKKKIKNPPNTTDHCPATCRHNKKRKYKFFHFFCMHNEHRRQMTRLFITHFYY